MRPSSRLIQVAILWMILGFSASLFAPLQWLWGAFGAFLSIVVAMEIRALRNVESLEIYREVAAALPLGRWVDVTLSLRLPEGAEGMKVTVFDQYPPYAEVHGIPRTVEVAPDEEMRIVYRVRAERRGDWNFGHCEVLYPSPRGLFEKRRFEGESTPIRVYPDFAAVAGYALMATDHRVSELGILKRRRRGLGTEFHQLRPYREGDVLRQIDWKATSRHGGLVSREYEDERDQQIVFLLDCGRRMHSKDGETSHFDHALNAVLLLSYVAVRQGDAIGFQTFGGRDVWRPPRKDRTSMNGILEGVYDLETTTAPSDFEALAERVMARQKRRALLVVLSNIRDEDDDDLAPALRLMRTRHLVLLASLREVILDQALEGEVRDLPDALRVGAVHRYLESREKTHEKFRHGGVQLLDVTPQELPVQLVNRYLDIKRSGSL